MNSGLMNKRIYQGLIILSLVLFVSFLIYNEQISEHRSLFSTIQCSLHSDLHTNTVSSWYRETDGAYYLFLPSYSDLAEAELTYIEGYELYLNDQSYDQYDTLEGLSFDTRYSAKLYQGGSLVDKSSLIIMKSSNIAAICISTDTGSMEYVNKNKDNKEGGRITVYTEEGAIDYSGGLKYISGRGNTTWEADKKPYNIELSEPVDLLDLGSADSWCLLANAKDNTNLRNKLVYDFADSIGMDYAPDSDYIDLYLNDQYMGLYLLAEKVEMGVNRVEIGDRGVLLELEATKARFYDAAKGLITDRNQMVIIHSDDDFPDEWIEMLLSRIGELEDAITASNGINPNTGRHYSEYIDVNSWVLKYITDEVFANHDSQWSSQYFYMTDEGRLFAGPVWDYDLTLGLPETSPATSNPKAFSSGWRENINTSPILWYQYLYENKVFKAAVKQAYSSVVQPVLYQYLTVTIQSLIKQIEGASGMNAARWNITDYMSDNNRLINYMKLHSEFLTDAWANDKDYCTIYFVSDVGTDIVYNYAVESGKCLDKLPIPVEEGYLFEGWFDKNTDNRYNSFSPITQDTTVYAKWTKETRTSIKNGIKNYYGVIPVILICIMLLSMFLGELISIRTRKVSNQYQEEISGTCGKKADLKLGQVK